MVTKLRVVGILSLIIVVLLGDDLSKRVLDGFKIFLDWSIFLFLG